MTFIRIFLDGVSYFTEMISKEKVEPKIIKKALKIINNGQLTITNRTNDFFENKYTAEVTAL